ncbi:unnamed protein product, partial [Rotaria sordida]
AFQGKKAEEKHDQASDPSKAPSERVDEIKYFIQDVIIILFIFSDLFLMLNKNKKMDAIKAGIEKAKETVQGKKAEEEARKASDPTVKPSERVDAAVEYGKAKMKEAEHACKAECHKDKHVCH